MQNAVIQLACWMLLLFVSACQSTAPQNSYSYNYPTGQQQRVRELCTIVFTVPYYQYISPSRFRKLRKIRTYSGGFWATFADGRHYEVPIESGLPLGQVFFCTNRPVPTQCASRNDWDTRCEWDQTRHPSRFQ